MNPSLTPKVLARVRRIVGQIQGVQKMIENDRYCVDILNQIAAVRSALDALGVELLSNHVESCIVGKPAGTAHAKAKQMKTEELIAELRTALSRFLQ
jgi:CsoR family transcriptional regulator, copper-sensing transcriptional repressor